MPSKLLAMARAWAQRLRSMETHSFSTAFADALKSSVLHVYGPARAWFDSSERYFRPKAAHKNPHHMPCAIAPAPLHDVAESRAKRGSTYNAIEATQGN